MSTVRLCLYDYDNAPDGCGTYVKVNVGFESFQAAVNYIHRFASSCWGSIYDVLGKRIADYDPTYSAMPWKNYGISKVII